MQEFIRSLQPAWLDGYDARAVGQDVLVGAVLCVLLIPQAMAYAQLAGLPPAAGLFTAMIAPMVYALLGRSAAVSMGPVALASLLVADAIGRHNGPAATVAAILALQSGGFLILLSLLRMGRLVNFISEPALLGFTAAAAFLIGTSQLSGLTGIDAARSGTLHGGIMSLWEAGGLHLPTLGLGLTALGGFFMGEPLMRRAALLLRLTGTARLALMKSAQLVVIVLVSAAALWLPDITMVEAPQSAIPALNLPLAAPTVWIGLLLPSLTVAIVVFVTGIAVAKSLSSRRRQAVNSNAEAFAIGAANLTVGVTGGYVAGVSLSRSALVHDVAARSPLSSAMAALIVLPVAAFGGALLAKMPVVALSALVISAIGALVKVKEIRSVVAHSRLEAMVIAATFLATLLLGVQWGLLAGATAGVFAFLWASSLPRITREGPDQAQNNGVFRSVARDAVDADTGPVLVLRIDRPLFFGNVGYAEEQVTRIVSEHPQARCLILDMRAVTDVDATGLRMLTRLLDNIEEKDLKVAFAAPQRPVQEALSDHEAVAQCAHYDTVEDANAELQAAYAAR